METKEFKTSGGYVATLKASLTFGDYRKIKNAVKEQFKFSLSPDMRFDKVEAKDVKFSEMDLNSLTIANDVALNLLLLKVADPKGEIISIDDLPPKDGQEVADEIDRITKEADIDQKKGV